MSMFNVHPDLAAMYLCMGKTQRFVERLERLHDYITTVFLPMYNDVSTDSTRLLVPETAVGLEELNRFIMNDGKTNPTLWPLCHRATPATLLMAYTNQMRELDLYQLNLISLYNFIWSVYFSHLPLGELIGCLISNGVVCDDENVQEVLIRFVHQVALMEVDGLGE